MKSTQRKHLDVLQLKIEFKLEDSQKIFYKIYIVTYRKKTYVLRLLKNNKSMSKVRK